MTIVTTKKWNYFVKTLYYQKKLEDEFILLGFGWRNTGNIRFSPTITSILFLDMPEIFWHEAEEGKFKHNIFKTKAEAGIQSLYNILWKKEL